MLGAGSGITMALFPCLFDCALIGFSHKEAKDRRFPLRTSYRLVDTMKMDHLSTELLTEILSYSVQEWSQKWLLDSKKSNTAYQDLRRYQRVCGKIPTVFSH